MWTTSSAAPEMEQRNPTTRAEAAPCTSALPDGGPVSGSHVPKLAASEARSEERFYASRLKEPRRTFNSTKRNVKESKNQQKEKHVTTKSNVHDGLSGLSASGAIPAKAIPAPSRSARSGAAPQPFPVSGHNGPQQKNNVLTSLVDITQLGHGLIARGLAVMASSSVKSHVWVATLVIPRKNQ